LLAIVLGDTDWFKILAVGFLSDVGGESGEAVTIVGILICVGSVPSPCLDNAPHVTTVVDLLPEISRRSIQKAGLGWNFALRPWVVLAVGWAPRSLHLLFNIATHGLLALVIAMADWIVLVALAIVIPPRCKTSSMGAINLSRVTMVLRS
jgi:hypothetical protein